MVLVITDSWDLSMVYAATLGGIMIEKQSVRRKNLDEHKQLVLDKAAKDGFLATFFRGEQYVFVCVPFETYALNRMVDYQSDYRELENRPIPFFPASFEYRCCDDGIEAHRNLLESFCRDASSIINATSDSMFGMLAFLHFQKMFQFNKMVTRVRPNILSDEKVLEAFNSREASESTLSFSEACLLFERLNWLVNCNVSNAIMSATKGRIPMAAGRIEAVLLGAIHKATDTAHGPYLIHLKNKATQQEITGYASCMDPAHPDYTSLKEKAKCTYMKGNQPAYGERKIEECFSIIIRSGIEYGIPLKTATEALWRLFVNGYITWPSTSKAMPWTHKPALTAAVSQLAKQDRFKGRISPSDIEKYTDWDRETPPSGRVAMIVTAKPPMGLSEAEQAIYNLVGEGIVRELTQKAECEMPVFQVGAMQIVSHQDVLSADAKNGTWVIQKVSRPGDYSYLDCHLLRDVMPFFKSSLCEDFRYFLPPLSNLVDWGMVSMEENSGLRVTRRGELLLKYTSSTPLIDPVATTFWDGRLLRVSNGVVSWQSVFAEVEEYINDLVSYVNVAIDVMEATGGIAPSECVCPRCGATLEWDNERIGWGCATPKQGCSFFLPGKFRGHTLTVRDMALLLTKGESDMAFDFTGTKAGVFPARLVLDAEKKMSLSFKSKCLCPKCKRQYMNEFQWGLACPDKACGFTAGTMKCGVRLTEADEVAIFSGKKTRPIKDFVSEKGKPFMARLYLGPDLKIKYDFQEK